MSDTMIYLELSDELQGVLADNGLNIHDILHQQGIDASITHGIPPYQSEDKVRTKDLVTIILASSVAVPAIAFAISQVLNTLHRKPHLIEYYENVELYDSKGNILRNETGDPIYKTVKCHELLEPQKQERPVEYEASFSLKNGLVLRFNTKEE